MNCARSMLLGFATTFLVLGTSYALAAEDAGASGNDALVGLVVDLLREKDPDMRALGMEQVRSKAPGEAATRRFATLLPTLVPEARVGLLNALTARGDAAARPAVLEVLRKDSTEPVREAAIRAVGILGETADIDLLIKHLGDDSKSVASAARTSLMNLRGDTTPVEIAEHMSEAEAPLRVELIAILAARRAFETIPAVMNQSVSDDPAVRTAAMSMLGQLAGPEYVAGMVKGVLKTESSGERAAAEKAIASVCSRIPQSDQSAQPLIEAMNALNSEDRAELLSTLGRVGGPAALKIVEQAIADDDARVHDLGIRALCNWPNATVAPQLTALATSDEKEGYKTMALRALLRVAPLPDERTDAERLALLKRGMEMAVRDDEKLLALDRARAIRTLGSLQFISPYMDQPTYAEQACLSVVELAHHRGLREPNKQEFDKALDKVIATSKDATVVDRAKRYKKDETWVRPK